MKTILLLDDDAEFRALVTPGLEARGYGVLQVERGAEATALLERRRVDLAVVDGLLPDVDGISWIARLRASNDQLPVVFVSAFWRDLASFNRLTRELGVKLVMHKPVLPGAFVEALDALLSRPVAAAEPPAPVTPVEVLGRMRSEYARELPGKLGDLAEGLRQLRLRPDASLASEILLLAHRLHGTAGSYGFEELGAAAGRIEEALGGASRGVLASGAWEVIEDALRTLAARAEAAARASLEAPGARHLDTGRVLLVSDDPAVGELGRRVGAEQLLEIDVHGDPASALAALGEGRPDAVVIGLPPRRAFALARDLRQRPGFEAVPMAIVGPGGALRDQVAAAHAGASVYLETPVTRAALDEAIRRLVAASQAQQPLVLVVDDDAGFTRRAVAVLRRAGILAQSLAEPSRILEVLEEAPFELVVLDAMLPGLSGYDVCRLLRATPRWQDLPILMASAHGSPEARLAAYQAGADDYLVKPVFDEELLARVRGRIERSRLVRERYDKDALTGLLLRRPFLEALRSRLLEASRHGRQLALCILDLDHFKRINDGHGHLAGDGVLATLGALLLRRFRGEDLRARWGGEEFVLAFPGEAVETIEGAIVRLLEEFRGHRFSGERSEAFTASFSAGIASFPADGETLEALLQVADRRLYAAKAAGRAAVVSRG